MEIILKRFESRDEVVHFEKDKFETVTLCGMTIGQATYDPYGSLHLLGAGKYAK